MNFCHIYCLSTDYLFQERILPCLAPLKRHALYTWLTLLHDSTSFLNLLYFFELETCTHSLRRDFIRLVKFLAFGYYFLAWLAIASKPSAELWVFHEMQGFKELAGIAPTMAVARRFFSSFLFPWGAHQALDSQSLGHGMGSAAVVVSRLLSPGGCQGCNVQHEKNEKCSRTERFADLAR